MESIKKYYKLSGNSILESVIALSIISSCLYIAILVYTSVFSPKTAPKFYVTNNKVDELFYLMQIENDSVNDIENENISTDVEFVNTNLKRVTIKYQDSIKTAIEKSYYIQINNE